MEMTFSQKVKEEITSQEFNDDQLKWILCGFLKNNIILHMNSDEYTWEIKTKSPNIVRFIVKSFIKLFDIEKNLSYTSKTKSSSRVYKLTFKGDFNLIEKNLMIFDDPRKLFTSIEDQHAFLIGTFLSGGSLNDPMSSNYHFEIRSHNVDLIDVICEILLSMNINAKKIERQNSYIVYVKKSESISDILKTLNALDSMFDYEDKRIYRDYSNQMHRLNNLDMSNLKKTIDASQKQIDMIKVIMNNSEISSMLSEKEKIFCKIRLEYPQYSLSEIALFFKTNYGIEVTRTGLNHYVRKIKKLIELI